MKLHTLQLTFTRLRRIRNARFELQLQHPNGLVPVNSCVDVWYMHDLTFFSQRYSLCHEWAVRELCTCQGKYNLTVSKLLKGFDSLGCPSPLPIISQ